MHFLRLFTFLLSLFLFGCSQKKSLRFEAVADTGIDFQNRVEDNTQFNIFTYRNFYNGAGVAIGDINNDSLPDVFFTANMGSNKLYLNKGDFKFEDISVKAGFGPKQKWSTGVVFVDVNADGWLDIYVCNAGYQQGVGQENELYINNKNGTFTERAKEFGLDDASFTTHAAFFDYDLDGDLDCYLLNNSFIPVNTLNYSNKRDLRAKDWPVEDFIKGGGDKLLRNDNGHYTDVSEEAGIYGSLIGFGLGVTVGDVNGDNYPDMYISNDFFERDYLYINQKNGTFKEELEQRMQHISLSSMGADMADINNDDFPDIFVTDMLPPTDQRLKTTSSFDHIDVFKLKQKQGFSNQYMQNTLQVNNRSGNFLETAYYSGVAASDWSWGGLIFDADNDGLSDIFVCNGIYHDVTDQDFIDFFADQIIQRMVLTGEKEEVSSIIKKMPSTPIKNKFFRNSGNLKFNDSGDEFGFTQKTFSNGAAYGDLDNDGDLDLIINNVNEPSLIYRNNSIADSSNFISVQLTGTGKNTFAIGSKIKIYADKEIISREVIPTRGFQSSCDYKQVIGLGKRAVDSMVILWPNNRFTSIQKPELNKVLYFSEKDAADSLGIWDKTPQVLFTKQDSTFANHVENNFVDFYYERNIPVMLSAEGPKAAVADVNNDGLDDIFIGAAKGSVSQLYLQTTVGFKSAAQPAFVADIEFEDISAVFFDADGDGDKDLAVSSGGNSTTEANNILKTRVYFNDGKGNFSRTDNSLLNTTDNGGGILAGDFDGDGTMDLFISGRSKPQNYGLNANSYFFKNDGKGNFSDVTGLWCKELLSGGLITSAAIIKNSLTNKQQLLVTGEWMAPEIYEFNHDRFEKVNTNIGNINGWWQNVTVADLDGDGDDDILLGNYGANFYLHPTSSMPVKLFINDFDKNSVPDKVITRTVEGKDVPVFLKRELQEQLPTLKKDNLKHKDFASKSIGDLFGADVLQKSTVKTISSGESLIAWNDGNNNYTLQPLPYWLQLSSINAFKIADVNADGKPDIIAAGNQFQFLPQFSRLDASYGWVLLNKGERKFEVLQQNQSGLFLKGAVKDIQAVNFKGSKYFLFLQNNQTPAFYRLNSF